MILNQYMLAGLTGILAGVTFPGINVSFVAWFALVPLFIALQNQKSYAAFRLSFFSGTITGLIICYWLLAAGLKYVGEATWIIPVGYFAMSLTVGLFYGIFGLTWSIIKQKSKFMRESQPFQIVTLTTIWILLEWIHLQIFARSPWNFYYIGASQWQNIPLLQWSSILGLLGLSTIVIITNGMLYIALNQKKWSYAGWALIWMLFFHSIGLGLYFKWESRPGNQSVRVSIIQENIAAQTRWEEASGDSLVNIFLDLNQLAVENDPDLILWSETAIPWTLNSDEPIIQEALKITSPSGADHIVGILSNAKTPGYVYNSAYYIQADGGIRSRVDKSKLLKLLETPLIERPFFDWIKIPVFRVGLQDNILAGTETPVLQTKYGLAGILICNESSIPSVSRTAVLNGAKFLVTMSNDAWFKDTIFPESHLAISRIRAVENRRDMIVNSNQGYAGFVSASGAVQASSSETSQCLTDTINTRSQISYFTRYGNWLIGLILVISQVLIKLATILKEGKK